MALHPLVAEHLHEIRALSEKYGVEKLEVFGSAMTDEFDPERSDVDFIVHYPDGYNFGDFGSRLFDLEEELAAALRRPAQLVMTSALKNSYFQDESSRTRWPVFPSCTTPPPSPHQTRDIRLRIERNLVDIQEHCRYVLEDLNVRSQSDPLSRDTMGMVIELNLMRIGQRARGIQRHDPEVLRAMPALQPMIPLGEEIANSSSSEFDHDEILSVASHDVPVIQREVEGFLASFS